MKTTGTCICIKQRFEHLELQQFKFTRKRSNRRAVFTITGKQISRYNFYKHYKRIR